jgi:hypothetical protein
MSDVHGQWALPERGASTIAGPWARLVSCLTPPEVERRGHVDNPAALFGRRRVSVFIPSRSEDRSSEFSLFGRARAGSPRPPRYADSRRVSAVVSPARDGSDCTRRSGSKSEPAAPSRRTRSDASAPRPAFSRCAHVQCAPRSLEVCRAPKDRGNPRCPARDQRFPNWQRKRGANPLPSP